MIRRVVITVLLLAAGFVTLHFTIGFENFTRSGAGGGGTPPLLEGAGEEQPQDPEGVDPDGNRAGGGVVVGDFEGGDGDAAIAVTGSGPTRFRRDEEYPQPDGTIHYVPQWILDAEDSETVEEDLMRLLRVTLTVHRIDPGVDGQPPTWTPIGTVTAREALVSVGRDEEGQPSIDEDREMDLFGVELEAASRSDGPVRDVELAVARLMVQHGDSELRFRTPSRAEPFELTMGGDDPMEVTGRGIEGSIPEQGLEGKLELRVRSDPTIVRGASRMRADGELRYVEDAASGYGRITMQDRVRVLGIGLDPRRAATTATGDRLSGVLVRYRGEGSAKRSSHGAAWRSLRLTGRPARLSQLGGEEEAGTLEVLSSTLDIRPDTAGDPWLFTAEGTPVVIDGRTGARFEAADKIHVADPRILLRNLHGAFGRRLPLPSMVGVLLLFEGESTIVDESRNLRVTASDGLRILRGDVELEKSPSKGEDEENKPREELGDAPLIAVGRGDVHVVREDLDVVGNDGFLLRLLGEQAWLRLGPEQADVAHRYTLTRSADEQSVTVRGSGSCQVAGSPDGAATADLVSPDETLTIETKEGVIRSIGRLHAELDADGQPTLLDAHGTRCAVDATLEARGDRPAERVSGVASHVAMRGPELILDGRSEGADPTPAVLVRETDRVEGSRIVLNRLDAERGIVHVEDFADGRPARVTARIPGKDPEAPVETVVLEATDLRAWPDLIPPLALAAHGLPRFAGSMLRNEAVLARGRASLQRLDADGKEVGRARGETLLFLPRLESGVLFGDLEAGIPAVVENLDERGRRSIGRAPEIRVAADRDAGAPAFELRPAGPMLPEIDVFGSGESSGDDAFENARILCDGVIRNSADTLSLDGPVQVRGLTALGEIDPNGVSMSAARLDLEWDPLGREIRRVRASQGAIFRFRDFLASGERVLVDVSTSRASVQSGGEQPARLELGGQPLTGAWFEANYRTLEYKAFAVRLGDATAGPIR